MKRFFRILAFVFLGLGLWRLYADFTQTISQGRGFRMRQAGEVWAQFDRESLLALQPAVERYISPRLWEWVFLPVLETPLFPMLTILMIFCFIASAKKPQLR